MERFARLQDIAEGVADRIREIGDFKLVTYAQATNGEQVWKMLQAMTNLPVAIVAIGTADFDEEALKRQIRVLVFVVGTFQRGTAAEARGVWQLVESVTDRFLPEMTPDGLVRPEVCGIEFVPASWSPISSPGTVSACSLSLEGIEFMNVE